MGFFYYSKVEFTTVNTFSNVTGFSHFTMVNTDLVCCGGNGGRMKAKFTIVNFPKTIWFIADISKLCLFSWHLVALFEMRSLSVTLLNTYTCIFSAASLFFSFFRASASDNFRFHLRQVHRKFWISRNHTPTSNFRVSFLSRTVAQKGHTCKLKMLLQI